MLSQCSWNSVIMESVTGWFSRVDVAGRVGGGGGDRRRPGDDDQAEATEDRATIAPRVRRA